MKKIVNTGVAAAIIFLSSCGAGTANKESGSDLASKKAQLEKLKDQQTKLNNEVLALEKEIGDLDPAAVKKEKTKLVALDTLAAGSFTHYIDLQGKIDALNVSYVAPRNGTGGVVTGVYVKNGDLVKKGQQLLKLDDAVPLKNLRQLETQLSYAEDVLQRRENLWKQNIGAEIDVITARNNVNNLKDQIATLKEQWSMTNVTADIDGVVDQINVREGEVFTGGQQIRIVNTQNLKATANVPENYLGSVKVGTNVKVVLPELNNKTLNAKVTVAGKLIDPNTRGFAIEARIPSDKNFHPNQIALIKIQDYTATNVISVPVNTVQNDQTGKYILVAAKEGGRLVAKKRVVQIGELYDDKVEIKSGLQAGDVIIKDGFQGLYDGQPINVS
jgi:membrane fusion protein (multidrug efflux system)